MAELDIHMTLDNADFEGNNIALATAEALCNLAERIREQSRAYLAGNGNRMRIADGNGNTIGFANFDIELEENEEA